METISKETIMRVKMPKAGELTECINDPNSWFVQKFPEEAKLHGVPFLVELRVDQDGLTHITPAFLNDSFFASIVCGPNQIVFFEPEELKLSA